MNVLASARSPRSLAARKFWMRVTALFVAQPAKTMSATAQRLLTRLVCIKKPPDRSLRIMATDVLMPQMGESIAEGTVSRWIKKVGDKVERDEPLLEISTDKVDAEIPSPSSGTLTEIVVQEGQTVAVNSVVARISD